MGFREFFDALLGRSRLPKAKPERLFAMTTARFTLESSLGLKPSGVAGLCFKGVESSAYASTREELKEFLAYSAKETETEFRFEMDEYGFLWVLFQDPDFEDLVANLHLVCETLIERGFGKQLLCAVYRFEAGNWEKKPGIRAFMGQKAVYWIFNFKQGTYYPFVPLLGYKRDNSFEFRLRAGMERELPLEMDVKRWYPLWEIPF